MKTTQLKWHFSSWTALFYFTEVIKLCFFSIEEHHLAKKCGFWSILPDLFPTTQATAHTTHPTTPSEHSLQKDEIRTEFSPQEKREGWLLCPCSPRLKRRLHLIVWSLDQAESILPEFRLTLHCSPRQYSIWNIRLCRQKLQIFSCWKFLFGKVLFFTIKSLLCTPSKLNHWFSVQHNFFYDKFLLKINMLNSKAFKQRVKIKKKKQNRRKTTLLTS